MTDQATESTENTPNLFDGVEADPAPAAQTEPPVNPFTDLLNGITNEDGSPKYGDVEAALKSIPNAQGHIKTLESELKTLREQAAKAENTEEIVQRLSRQQTENQTQSFQNPEELEDAIDSRLAAREKTKLEQTNLEQVGSKFAEVFGTKASDEMSRIATESGVTLKWLENMARTSPKALFKLAGISAENVPENKKTRGTINTESLATSLHERPKERKSIMYGADTKQVISAWNAAGETARAKLG